METDRLFSRYQLLLASKELSKPVVRIDGSTYDWLKPVINVSSIPRIVKGCTYRLGLEAKKGSRYEFSKESKDIVEEGSDLHEEVGMEIVPNFTMANLSKKEERSAIVKDVSKASLEGLKDITEFYLPGFYKGFYYGGYVDYCKIGNNKPVLVEEWKFSKKLEIQEKYKIQALIYCYFIYRLFKEKDFYFSIKVWDRKKWSLDEQLEYLFGHKTHYVESATSQDWLFDSRKIELAEILLDKVTNFFTGKLECESKDNLFCKKICEAYEDCSYAKDWD